MKLNLEIELEDCPYWDYEIHRPSHTCNNCESDSNGLRFNGDRYCIMCQNIHDMLIAAAKKEEESMGIKNVSLAVLDEDTVGDILNDMDEVNVVCVREGKVDHAYIGDNEIDTIDSGLLRRPVKSCFVSRYGHGYSVRFEV